MDKLTSALASAKATDAGRLAPSGESQVYSTPLHHPARTDSGTIHPSANDPATEAGARGLGAYVHFPWCIRKCPYCDFLSVPSALQDIPHRAYADAVVREVEARRSELGARALRSVFFGGGTPSLWKPAELGRVLRSIRDAFGSARDASSSDPDGDLETGELEITVECNPGSLSVAHARALLDAGVNRLSVGVQALDEARLRFLGRWHSAEQALAALGAALEAGMPRVSGDLIFGVHGQTAEQAASEVRRLAQVGVQHVSAYALTIEPQTAFGALARKGRLPQAPEQSVADSFVAVDAELSGLGFEHYEISNFAQPGQRAQHNLGYWRGLEYVGLGCGAYGTVQRAGGRFRYRNRPQPHGYIETASGLDPQRPGALRTLESESEQLTADVLLSEALMLGLRLADGVDVERAAHRTGAAMWTPARRSAVQRLTARGQLHQDGPRLSIPKAAWLFSDGIISQLI